MPEKNGGPAVLCAGIDVGSSAIKVAVVEEETKGGKRRLLAHGVERIRKRHPLKVLEELFQGTIEDAGVSREELDYIATTGEGEIVPFRTGHFYGMTAHARGALHVDPEARAAIDIGALHTRAILMDERAKVLGYRMTSQCASGSGQFLENIGRYLGVTLEEIGPLSLQADDPEACSSICAVLAETDVINMVSRGITVPNIIKGIHQSMAGRYLRLITATRASGVVMVTGGLAADVGLLQAMREASEEQNVAIEIRAHRQSVLAGALGAAIWGAFRFRKLAEKGVSLSA
ncbi:MAG TPA: benzoyl-CoA reductase subunit D [Vicinamibacteria bacterium]|nr:benzoyl-CoA reductase subunit D [Vicinamibacteria bacterium]